MLHAVRLRQADARKGFELSTYVSAATSSRYTAGTPNMPATLHVVENQAELAELSEIPQFQIVTCKDMQDLKALVQREMEERARGGLPAVHAYVQKGQTSPPPATDADKPKGAARPSLGQVLRKKADAADAAEAKAAEAKAAEADAAEDAGKDPTDNEGDDPEAADAEGTTSDDQAQTAAQAPQGNGGRRGKGK